MKRCINNAFYSSRLHIFNAAIKTVRRLCFFCPCCITHFKFLFNILSPNESFDLKIASPTMFSFQSLRLTHLFKTLNRSTNSIKMISLSLTHSPTDYLNKSRMCIKVHGRQKRSLISPHVCHEIITVIRFNYDNARLCL